MQVREKVEKSRDIMFFQWFVAPEGRKVGSLKRRVRSQLARWVMKNCTPLWREAHFQVKMYITHQVRTTFGGSDVEKVHAVLARSTFPSKNVQKTRGADHFWQLRCQKSAHRCGAKHISKSKMYKTLGVRTTFGGWDVEKVHAVVARSAFRSQNVQNNRGPDHFWRLRCRKSARPCGAKHISKWKCSKRKGFGSLLEVQMSLRFTTLHYITLHYTPLHYRTLHYTTLQYTTLHYTTLQYTPLHKITLHHTTLHYTTLHYTTLHYITLHYTTLHYTTLHYQLHN